MFICTPTIPPGGTMYATLAIGLDGKRVPIDMLCNGDGNPAHSCGKRLYFSHDVEKGDQILRYASCLDHHSWMFSTSLGHAKPIQVSELGTLINDSAGRTVSDEEIAARPILVALMTNDEDVFLKHAGDVREAAERTGHPDRYRVIQAPAPTKPPPKRPKKQPPKRKRRPKRT